MDYKELFGKYQALLAENSILKEELRNLKAQLGIVECQVVSSCEDFNSEPEPEMPCTESENSNDLRSGINKMCKLHIQKLP